MRIALFFSDGMSLEGWRAAGILGRELALYRLLECAGIETTLVTYGRRTGRGAEVDDMIVLDNGVGLPHRAYSALLPWLHARALRRCDVFKTNQLNGAMAALRCARRLRRPLVARGGYLWSDFATRQHGEGSAQLRRALATEDAVFRYASRIVVTTGQMQQAVQRRVPEAGPRVVVIPNYVDTGQFAPPAQRRPTIDALYVGRLEAQKNVDALLGALTGSERTLTLVGDGAERDRLHALARECGVRASWVQRVPHHELPRYMNDTRVFVMPSHYEGHPKALIEAMSCGCAVLGADSPGIRELLRHGETGWLCEPNAAAIGDALARLLGDAALRERLGAAARKWVCDHYSLDQVCAREASLLQEVAQEHLLQRAPRSAAGR